MNSEDYENLSKRGWFVLWKYKYMMVENYWNTKISCEINKGVKEELT